MMRKGAFAVVFLFAVVAIFIDLADADEHSGTWKLNSAKSKYSPGPAPKDLTETISIDQNHYKVNGYGTTAEGLPMHIEFDAKFDGKDYPMNGVPWADSLSVRRIDAHTPQIIQKKGGQVSITITCNVSADGKTRTCTLKGKDAQGREVKNIAVFDRQ